MKNIYITVFLSLFLVSTSYAQIYLSGELSGTLDDTTYIVEGDIVVPSYLHIDPGAVLRFNEDVQFTVYGDLFALGTISDSIYFELNNEASGWGGIDICFDMNTSSTGWVELEHCVITGSNSSGIYIEEGHLKINDCRLSNNSAELGGAVYIDNSLGVVRSPIQNCTISENIGGGLILDEMRREIQILDCIITNNIGTGLSFFTYGGETRVSGCTISYNVNNSPDGVGGIKIPFGSGLNYPFDYCEINYNHGGYIGGISYEVQIKIDHCTFVGNSCDTLASAIGSFSADDSISNCIFDSNIGGLGAIAVHENRYHILNNNLFFNNSNVCSTSYQGDIPPNPYETIDRINLNCDSCDSFYNLYIDPRFVDRDALDFHLQPDSPCIDAGTPEYPLDGDHSYTDIGAYSFYQSGIAESSNYTPNQFGIRKIYPNPFNNKTTIMINVQQPGKVGLFVYDILGRKVETLTYNYKQSGTFLIPFNGNSLPSGNYFIQYRGEDGYSSRKITLLK